MGTFLRIRGMSLTEVPALTAGDADVLVALGCNTGTSTANVVAGFCEGLRERLREGAGGACIAGVAG